MDWYCCNERKEIHNKKVIELFRLLAVCLSYFFVFLSFNHLLKLNSNHSFFFFYEFHSLSVCVGWTKFSNKHSLCAILHRKSNKRTIKFQFEYLVIFVIEYISFGFIQRLEWLKFIILILNLPTMPTTIAMATALLKKTHANRLKCIICKKACKLCFASVKKKRKPHAPINRIMFDFRMCNLHLQILYKTNNLYIFEMKEEKNIHTQDGNLNYYAFIESATFYEDSFSPYQRL